LLKTGGTLCDLALAVSVALTADCKSVVAQPLIVSVLLDGAVLRVFYVPQIHFGDTSRLDSEKRSP